MPGRLRGSGIPEKRVCMLLFLVEEGKRAVSFGVELREEREEKKLVQVSKHLRWFGQKKGFDLLSDFVFLLFTSVYRTV